ncbi:hypothetical protein G5T42_12640 [Microbacterium sp. 4R-513]|uniref:hypothetical protein n=1 Tax=Microbacterium sp. 4R-513 TaxID=2567934 RepID=UPI0013E16C99|nr:hypothetical protein [Microbacterium sp. 4R-513]QIG40223.1 hypothetical protein G5T42_12640 [Microbacterium sp. 4R-513]
MKRGTLLGIAIGAVVAMALALGAWWFLSRDAGPEATAKGYLDALAAGDGDRALELLAEQPSGDADRAKALDEAQALITDVAVAKVTQSAASESGTDHAGRAEARVTYTLDGAKHAASLGLVERDGGWRIDSDGLGTLTPQTTLGSYLLVGDVPVPAGAATALLPALYPVEAAPKAIVAGSTTAAVTLGEASEAAVEASVSPDAITTAQQQLDLYAQRCAAPAEAVPANCGIRVPWAADLATLTSIAFRIERSPQLTLAPDLTSFSATDGILIATATGITRDGAEASFTYRADDWSLRGAVTLTRDDMKLAVG